MGIARWMIYLQMDDEVVPLRKPPEILFNQIYPLVICYIAIENHHFSWANSTISMVIFNSYFDITRG